ncbi:MAG: carboxypeptidase-like regulatory domain-containing protein, partial [Acidobacteriota bacterium]
MHRRSLRTAGVVVCMAMLALPSISRRVTLTETGARPPVTESTITDDNGAFRFIGIAPGPFQLTLSSSGFVTQTVNGVLHAGETWDAHTIVLPVADTTSSVEVTASRADIAQAQLNIEEKQ